MPGCLRHSSVENFGHAAPARGCLLTSYSIECRNLQDEGSTRQAEPILLNETRVGLSELLRYLVLAGRSGVPELVLNSI